MYCNSISNFVDGWISVEEGGLFMNGKIQAMHISVERLLDGPIVYPGLSSIIGNNIQGPSAIRVPDWVDNKLGEYYLYFADHKGTYIRLAYADQVQGPWTIYPCLLYTSDAADE